MFGLFLGNVGSQTTSAYSPLLDSFTTTAEFAWSVWQMSASQTQCVRLRRDSDNAESDFGFTASGLVDTSAITSWLGGANAYVVTYYGVTRNATESSASDQGQFFTSGGNDNLPYAIISPTSTLTTYDFNTSITASTQIDIVTMANHEAVSASYANIFSTSNSAVRFWVGYIDNGVLNATMRVRVVNINNSSTYPGGTFLGDTLIRVNRNSSNNVVVDSNTVSIINATISDSAQVLGLYNTSPVGGMRLSTALFFNANLTSPERASVISFYNTYFNKSL